MRVIIIPFVKLATRLVTLLAKWRDSHCCKDHKAAFEKPDMMKHFKRIISQRHIKSSNVVVKIIFSGFHLDITQYQCKIDVFLADRCFGIIRSNEKWSWGKSGVK